jgi:hypothetical protein
MASNVWRRSMRIHAMAAFVDSGTTDVGRHVSHDSEVLRMTGLTRDRLERHPWGDLRQ